MLSEITFVLNWYFINKIWLDEEDLMLHLSLITEYVQVKVSPPPCSSFTHLRMNSGCCFPESSHLLTPPLVCGDLPPPPSWMWTSPPSCIWAFLCMVVCVPTWWMLHTRFTYLYISDIKTKLFCTFYFPHVCLLSPLPGPPLPPQDVQVLCGPAPGVLQVHWKPPPLSPTGTSNGANVVGYAVCTKGQRVSSSVLKLIVSGAVLSDEFMITGKISDCTVSSHWDTCVD